jgi:hypothetical protein
VLCPRPALRPGQRLPAQSTALKVARYPVEYHEGQVYIVFSQESGHDRRRHHQRQPPHPRTGPGFLVSLIVAAPRVFSEHYQAPVMLFALLLGMALNFLAGDGRCKAGIEFTARTVLRLGVALLGMRITWARSPAWAGSRWCWW